VMTMQVKRCLQTIFYFSHQEVVDALLSAVQDDLRRPPAVIPRITAGLDMNSGLTLTFQETSELKP
jgi:hypothetical protein